MATPIPIPLGAPGIYPFPDSPIQVLTGVRMDVCGFAGVAPRGPVRVPVVNEQFPDTHPCVEPERPTNRTQAYAVESFDAYKQLYGAFEGPGLLPYAVASFFEQGGRRAYIARIVHDYGVGNAENKGGVASGIVLGAAPPAGDLVFRARSEGSWGNGLRVELSFEARPVAFESAATNQISFDEQTEVTAGTLLRLTVAGGLQVLRFVTALVFQPRADRAGIEAIGILETPAPGPATLAEIVTGILDIDDGAGHTETLSSLGLASEHPRWAALAVCHDSALVYPDASWIDSEIVPGTVNLEAVPAPDEQFKGGEDRYADITPDDFFDPNWLVSDEDPGQGVQCFAQIDELSLLVVPDLYSPAPLDPIENIIDPLPEGGPDFQICVDVPPVAASQGTGSFDLTGLRLDPKRPGDLQQISALQANLVNFAETVRSFVVLLDVPPGLNQRAILKWRTTFDSSYAAAYHPWLEVSRRDDSRDQLVQIPPSAAAAGIIANSEILFGVPTGPANVLAAQVVNVADVVSPPRHDELHPQGINVYLRERDGVRLTSARTLSRDPQFRQLTVRRLVVLIRRTLYEQMQWAVFEPNDDGLRREVRLLIEGFLSTLFQQGAFRGANESDGFFVRCDETNNPPFIVDAGRLIAEIGIAPTEPIEFIVLRLAREGDGTLSIQG